MAQVSENFSTTTKKDGAHTTAYWDDFLGRLTLVGGVSNTGGFHGGSVISTNETGGSHVPWTNPGYSITEDGNFATVTLATNLNGGVWTSEWLKATNFGFNIPYGASITGIKVEIKAKSDHSSDYWAGVRLVKNGSISASGRTGVDGELNTTNRWNSLGGNGDLWGDTWTRDDINNANFGVAFRNSNQSMTAYTTYSDDVKITVYYTYYYADNNVAQSINVGSTFQNIPRATLSKVDYVPGGLNIEYCLSNDGGANFYTVVPDVQYTFPTTGNDLRWKIIIHGTYVDSPPYVDSIIIDYDVTPISLSVSDEISLTEYCGKKPNINISDSFSISDAFSYIKGILLFVNETLTITENISKSLLLSFGDVVTVIEGIGKKTSQIFQESFSVADSSFRSICKNIFENLTIVETISKRISKSFVDAITTIDLFVFKLRETGKNMFIGFFSDNPSVDSEENNKTISFEEEANIAGSGADRDLNIGNEEEKLDIYDQ